MSRVWLMLLAVPHEPFDDPRLTAAGLFVEAFNGLVAQLGPIHARHGMSGTEFDTLLRLARSPERRLRMSDLAQQIAFSTSGITRVVDRLENNGLLRRIQAPGDRRSCYAMLTDAGHERLSSDVPELVTVIEQWFTGALEPDELDAFLAALRRLRDAVHPGAVAGATTAGSDTETVTTR